MFLKKLVRIIKLPYKYYKAGAFQRLSYKKVLLEKLAEKMGLDFLFFTDIPKKDFLKDPLIKEFLHHFSIFEVKYSLDRKFVLSQLLKYTTKIKGDYLECGVFKGASAYLMCKFIELHNLNKTVYLVDSFEGLSEPDQKLDGLYWKAGDLKSQGLNSVLYNFPFIKVYKGWIPNVFRDLPSNLRISFAHVDVDLYQPTKDSLLFILPRLENGGIVLFDDYFFETCPGAKKAVDEILGEENVIILPTGQSFYIKLDD